MGTPSTLTRSLLVGVAMAIVPAAALASESERAPPALPGRPRREVTLALGYGTIISPRPFVTYAATGAPMLERTFSGVMLEVTTRRWPTFEYGLGAWTTGGSSDGKGNYAHVLLRFTVEARWLPWGYGRVEPWVGAQIGLAAADDFAKWDATADEKAHSASVARIGRAAALETGLRGRLGEFFALGLRGGLSYMSFTPIRGPVGEPGDTDNAYVVYPNDYARRIWYSAMLTAEVTVPD
jgi:hypothetical protein